MESQRNLKTLFSCAFLGLLHLFVFAAAEVQYHDFVVCLLLLLLLVLLLPLLLLLLLEKSWFMADHL